MLWDLIRDFFVEHVFGGYSSGGVAYSGLIGKVTYYVDGQPDDWTEVFLTDGFAKIGQNNNGVIEMSLGDWLSTTATAISITIIVVLCCLFVYKIIKLIGGLIR